MKVLFVSSGNTDFKKIPFIESQEKSLIDQGISVDHFLIMGKGLKGYAQNIAALRKMIQSGNYDLLHAHYSYSGWIALFTGTSLPIVVSYMGSDVYGLVNESGQRTLKSYQEIFISKSLQPFVDKIIVKSKNLEDYIYLKKKASLIPNGVDFEKFQPRDKKLARAKLDLPLEKEIVLFLGSDANPRKNFQLCKEAFDTIKQENWELVHPYPIDADLIPYYLNAASVLVLTSYLEGSPNVIKEAMASNTPIVATDVGDVREVIGKTEGCYLCSFDVQDVAKNIQQAINFGRPTMGRTNTSHLEINTIARRLIELYESVIKN